MHPKTWDVVSIYTRLPKFPHEKHCICIDAERREVFFINSEPPRARKAKVLAVTITSFECHGLDHDISYVDTTAPKVMPADEWATAIANPDKHKGPLSPTLIERMRSAIRTHGQLTKDQRGLLGVIDVDC